MARPSENQQLRARARIRSIIEMRPDGQALPGELPRYVFAHKRGIIAGHVGIQSQDGRTIEDRDIYSEVPAYGLGFANTFGFPLRPRGSGQSREAAKLRVGRLLGYKGKRKNIIRSVNRVIMRDRESKQARNLKSTKQVEKIDRSFNYYRKKTGAGVIDRNIRLDIKGAVKVKVNLNDFRDNADSVFNDNRRFEPTDVITIFNKRVEILLSQEDSDSKAYAVVFDESGLDAEARAYLEEARVRLVLYARDIIPDNDNMTTVVVN
jgi:hypothetical protein